jgi:hypothetical protein
MVKEAAGVWPESSSSAGGVCERMHEINILRAS